MFTMAMVAWLFSCVVCGTYLQNNGIYRLMFESIEYMCIYSDVDY